MKTAAMMLGFLLCAAMMLVQTAPASSSNQNQTNSGQTTLVGCLNHTGNSYTLIDTFGRAYDLTGDSTLLAPYEGAKVEISGAFANATPQASTASSIPGSTTDSGTANTGTGASEQGHGSFSVVGVTKAADTCSMHN